MTPVTAVERSRALAGRAGKSVSNNVGLPHDMAHAGCKLSDEGEVPLLQSRHGVRLPVEGPHQWLVIGKHHEAAPLQHAAEMANCRHCRQQLPVKAALVHLGLVQLN
jgi:hypothetical protein